MKRRQLMRYAATGAMTALGTALFTKEQTASAQATGNVTIRFLGHTCFLFTGDGRRVLVNPFRPVGCTAGYSAPQQNPADLVLISSRLFDEGYIEGIPADTRILSEPGIFQFQSVQVQGIRTDHDRVGGRRFGNNVAWRWRQGGLDLLHLGGIAAPITVEQQILMGRPDVMFVPVGGGPKAFDAQEAQQAIRVLNPRIVVPTHFRTQAADPNACDIETLDGFLTLMSGTPINRRNSDTMTLSRADLPSTGPRIEILTYRA